MEDGPSTVESTASLTDGPTAAEQIVRNYLINFSVFSHVQFDLSTVIGTVYYLVGKLNFN